MPPGSRCPHRPVARRARQERRGREVAEREIVTAGERQPMTPNPVTVSSGPAGRHGSCATAVTAVRGDDRVHGIRIRREPVRMGRLPQSGPVETEDPDSAPHLQHVGSPIGEPGGGRTDRASTQASVSRIASPVVLGELPDPRSDIGGVLRSTRTRDGRAAMMVPAMPFGRC